MKTYPGKLFFLVVLTTLFPTALADENFFWKCDSKKICTLFAETVSGRNVQIYTDWREEDTGNLGFKAYSNNLMEFSYGCGSPCYYSTFFNFKTGEVSDSFFLVEAVDPEQFLIALPDPEDNDDNTLLIIPIFGHSKQTIKIKRSFTHGVSISLMSAKFTNDKLYIDYNSGKNYNAKQEVIPINYKILKNS